MSRWLWALLGGVVLVAIAALFWTVGNRTNVIGPASPGPTAVAPAPAPPAPPAPVAQEPSPAPPAAQEAPAPSAPSPIAPAPTPAPDAGQQATPPATPPPPETPSAPPVAEAPLPPPAPGRDASEVQGVYAPNSLAQLVGAWAYSPEDCERLFQRRGRSWAYRQPVDKFAQAAIVEFDEEDPAAFRHLPDRERI